MISALFIFFQPFPMRNEMIHHRPEDHPRLDALTKRAGTETPRTPEREPDVRRLPSMRLLSQNRLRMHQLLPEQVYSYSVPMQWVTMIRETLHRFVSIE